MNISSEMFSFYTFASARLYGISFKACLQVCVSIFLQVGDITNLDITDLLSFNNKPFTTFCQLLTLLF